MFRSPLFPIFLTVLVDVLGLTLVLPLLPFYAEHFGASPVVVGALASSYAICQLVSGPILGRVSDRVGRKPTLLFSQMGTLIGFSILASADALWMLFLGRIIDGLTAGNLSIAQAYISDVTKPENRTKAFGLIGVAFGAGFLFGPAISGVLASRFGFASPMVAAAGLSLTSILVTAALLPDSRKLRADAAAAPAPSPSPSPSPSPEVDAPPPPPPPPPPTGTRNFNFGEFFRRPLPRLRLLEFFCFTTAFSTLVGGLALFLERRFHFDVEKTGYVYALSGLVGGTIQGGLIGRLVKRLGEERLAQIGFLSMAIGYGFLALAYDLPVLLGLIVIGSFGSAVTRPSVTTLITRSVGRDEQGAALGTSQSLASISQIAGPLLAGTLIEHQLLGAYGIAAGSFALVGATLLLKRAPES